MAFLGCSRGLGRAVCKAMDLKGGPSFSLLVSRSTEELLELSQSRATPDEILTLDFSNPDSYLSLAESLIHNQVQRIFYFAGGGPFGNFAHKSWKDHQWAMNVSFLTPARLLHEILSNRELSFVKQFILIGSRIADDRPDSQAASYCAAKHALRGLVESVQLEKPEIDLRLFRPGYMDTALLPKNARPRLDKVSLRSPEESAQEFVNWVLDPSGPKIFDLKD